MIEASDLLFQRNGVYILNSVNLQVLPGELVVLLGPNGAGKSSLLRVLAGWQSIQQGQVLLNGRPVSNCSHTQRQQQLSVLSQFNPVVFDFTVDQLLRMGEVAPDTVQLAEIVSKLEIDFMLPRNYFSLSGGEKQRVHWARVLVQLLCSSTEATQFCLLDEPTAHLDIRYQHLCFDYLKSLLGRNFGVLAVLHDVGFALKYADRVLLLDQGSMIFDGKPAGENFRQALSRLYHVDFKALYADNLALLDKDE